jgi:Putative transposase
MRSNPSAVLDSLGRYTHRVAIANSRLININDTQVQFRWKNYQRPEKSKLMTLGADEFIRRFVACTTQWLPKDRSATPASWPMLTGRLGWPPSAPRHRRCRETSLNPQAFRPIAITDSDDPDHAVHSA